MFSLGSNAILLAQIVGQWLWDNKWTIATCLGLRGVGGYELAMKTCS